MKHFIFALLLCAGAQAADESHWSFKSQAPIHEHATGLLPHAHSREVENSFHQADVPVPKVYDLSIKEKLAPIFDQGQCGSCVYNSVVKNVEDSYLLRKVAMPVLSRQYLMDYGNGGGCNGSYFENEGKDLLDVGGLPPEKDYPYVAYNQRPQSYQGQLYGKIASYKIITNSPKSIMSAIYSGYPVSVTIGANWAFQSYQSGIYNACSHTSTNHEVLLEGWDCESSVDGNGNCVFDAKGNLPAGVGTWVLVNSWGTSWGEQGKMKIKITDEDGSLCNNVADEAGILEIGVPMPSNQPAVPELPFWGWLGIGIFLLSGIGIGIEAITLRNKKS